MAIDNDSVFQAYNFIDEKKILNALINKLPFPVILYLF